VAAGTAARGESPEERRESSMEQPQGVGSRLLGAIKAAETAICGVGLIITTLLIVAQVINRYILHFEIMILNDLALYTFVFFMLLAAAYTTWNEGHVAVDVFREWLVKGRPVAAAVYRVSLVFLSIATLCLLLPIAYAFMRRAMEYPEWGTLVRWFNTSWLQILVFWSLLLVLLHLLVIARRDVAQLIQTIRARPQREDR
jgi:TRAP-type C4-dicarboxylate transport system permease small subunit